MNTWSVATTNDVVARSVSASTIEICVINISVVNAMPATIKLLLQEDTLQQTCKDLSVSELESIHKHLQELIAERRESDSAAELKRKGERTLDDMRGLMAKAGISMQEFQAALDGN